MIRNLKALGLALFAAFAMSAMVASAASATPFHFTANNDAVTTIEGDDDGETDVFVTNAGKVSCLGASYKGSVTGTTTASVEVEPTYSECHIIVLFTFKVTIHMNGCKYRFTATTFNKAKLYEGTADIICPEINKVTQKIVVTAPGCTITVPEQNGLKTVTYTPNAGNTDITVDADLTGITYEEHNGSPNTCKTNTVLQHNGTYTGNSTVVGNKGAVAIGVKTTP